MKILIKQTYNYIKIDINESKNNWSYLKCFDIHLIKIYQSINFHFNDIVWPQTPTPSSPLPHAYTNFISDDLKLNKVSLILSHKIVSIMRATFDVRKFVFNFQYLKSGHYDEQNF